MTSGTDEPKLEALHPPLEDFVIAKSQIQFFDFQKLNELTENIRYYHHELENFVPTDYSTKHFGNPREEVPKDNFDSDEEGQGQIEPIDPISSEILISTPPLAPPTDGSVYPDDKNFSEYAKRHAQDRAMLSESFRTEEFMLYSNYYDAQLRENMQKNEMVDKRPLSEALRFLSKRVSYPIELASQRFYKYNIRMDKLARKHKRNLERINQIHEQRAEILYHQQAHDLLAYGDINKVDIENNKIPHVPVEAAHEAV